MSLGYADRLSHRRDVGGQLGAPEYEEPYEELERKVSMLAQLFQAAKKVVVFTGAGISTACGIPDFRGPSGIWTLRKQGKDPPRGMMSFPLATPSFTHAALTSLVKAGRVSYVVSQNVDGLHLRSGMPRTSLAELHGNCFIERCNKCSAEYMRDWEIQSVGFKPTGRSCVKKGCNGMLHDFVLDWEDALPEKDLLLAESHSREADLAICLGTSLQITPACNIPLKTIRKTNSKPIAGKLVIINLQSTPHDKKAERSGGLVIRGRADEVMRMLMAEIGHPVPPYIRKDSLLIKAVVDATAVSDHKLALLTIDFENVCEKGCPLPMVDSVSLKMEPTASWRTVEKPPFQFRCELPRRDLYQLEASIALKHPIDLESPLKKKICVEINGRENKTCFVEEWSFISQRVSYSQKDDSEFHGNGYVLPNELQGKEQKKRRKLASV